MLPQSSSLTIDPTVLKESHALVILEVNFDSNMTFEKYLRTVSRAASQRLGMLRKSWRVFHNRSLLGRCFCGFVRFGVLFCSVVFSCRYSLKLLDSAVNIVPGF